MDIVITYVNGLDPLWQKEYERYTNAPILEKRFRDWGTLRYLFRGIEKNMPFIRKVHLVVSQESQVPEWINRDEVNVVFHQDIIPAVYLPTFNCNPIETHLHCIEDLDEEFLYFNDDFFPVAKCESTDFFRNGKGVIRMSRHILSINMFKQICRNSDCMARKALGSKKTWWFLRPQHICTPMLKSECKLLYDKMKDEIFALRSTIRTRKNINQYMFLDYMFLKGKIINKKISKKHISIGFVSSEKLFKAITQPSSQLLCINDVQISEKKYIRMKDVMLDGFSRIFPEKSKYEN